MTRKVGDIGITVEELRASMPQLLEMIGRGASPQIVAATIGIHRRSWWRWRELAKGGIEPYATFMDAFLRAEALYMAGVQIGMAEGGQLLPGAWILERRLPDQFSLSEKFRAVEEDAKQDPKEADRQRVRELAARYRASGASPEAERCGLVVRDRDDER